MQLGAGDARLLFAAQGEEDRDLWRKVDLIRRQEEKENETCQIRE